RDGARRRLGGRMGGGGADRRPRCGGDGDGRGAAGPGLAGSGRVRGPPAPGDGTLIGHFPLTPTLSPLLPPQGEGGSQVISRNLRSRLVPRRTPAILAPPCSSAR